MRSFAIAAMVVSPHCNAKLSGTFDAGPGDLVRTWFTMRRLPAKSPQIETRSTRLVPGYRLITVVAALTLLTTMCTVCLTGVAFVYALRKVAAIDNWLMSCCTVIKDLNIKPIIPRRSGLSRWRHNVSN